MLLSGYVHILFCASMSNYICLDIDTHTYICIHICTCVCVCKNLMWQDHRAISDKAWRKSGGQIYLVSKVVYVGFPL